MKRLLIAAFVIVHSSFVIPLSAQVPNLINYQGRVAVGTLNFTGAGFFRFALVDTTGANSYWSNDGTSANGSQPTAPVSLTVTNGLYSVLLGDTTVTGMSSVIPATVWTNADVRLRVWFDDGTHGPQLLSPDQRLAPNGFLPTGSVTAAKLASGAVQGTNIANGTIANSNLVNPSLTVAAGSGLSGGGLVSLGGSVTLANSGVLSLSGGGGVTVTGSTGSITLGSTATNADTPGAIVARDANGNFSAGAITATLTGNASTATSATSFTGSLSGDVTGTQSATSISPATITGKALTGFSSTSGTITASDSILTAIDKLYGNDALKATLASPSFTGTVTLPAGVSSAPPLLLQTGVNLTAPAFGALEFDGANLYVTTNSASPTRQTIAFTNSTISAAQIANGTITSAMIASGAVGNAQLASGAVQSANIASGSVGSTQLAANAVQSANIAAGAVTNTQMAAESITGANLATQSRSGTMLDGVLNFGTSGSVIVPIVFSPALNVIPTLSQTPGGWTFSSVSATGFTATNSFTPQTVDFATSVGAETALTVNAAGQPEIAYYDATNGKLKFAVSLSGSSSGPWTIVTIGTAVNNLQLSIAMVGGYPCIAFSNASNSTGAAFATCSTADGTGTWTVTSVGDGTGNYASIASVSGRPAISSENSGTLKYAIAANANGTGGWTNVTPDSSSGIGDWTSLAVVNGNPAISYRDNTNSVLKYVRSNDSAGATWGTPVVVDSATPTGTYSSLKTVSGNPAISYFDSKDGFLKFVRANDVNGATWGAPVTVDNAATVGRYCSLGIVNGRPVISYYDANHLRLKFAYPATVDGSGTWTAVSVDASANVGNSSSLAVINGGPAISYYDATNLHLKYSAIPEINWSASEFGTAGPITSVSFSGAGSALTSLNASNISSGTLPDANLSSNIPLLNSATNVFTNSVTVGGLNVTSTNVLSQNGQPILQTNGTKNFFAGVAAGNATAFGADNTAVGYQALSTITSGGNNIAVGYQAGSNITSGSGNIDIGHAGVAGDAAIIRIGDGVTQTDTYLTGVLHGNGSQLTGIVSQPANNPTLSGAVTFTGSFTLPVTTSATVGSVNQNGQSILQTYGTNNFFAGAAAGNFTTSGANNTATGFQALTANTSGGSNAAYGSQALAANTNGFGNAAFGYQALQSNTTSYNTAFGCQALQNNTSGSVNLAMGPFALQLNTTGEYNTGLGVEALGFNTTGNSNVAVGINALESNSTGSNNTAIGYQAGLNLTTGSNNIDIGHEGVAAESNTIRIGDGVTQTNTYLTGIVHFPSTVALAAGTSTIPPLTLQTGVNLTAPVFGALEFDGTHLYVTNNSGAPTRNTIAFTNSAITASQIANGLITSAMLAANSVQSADIAAGAVGASQLAAGAVGSSQLAANAVQAFNIAANAVGTAQLAAGAMAAPVGVSTTQQAAANTNYVATGSTLSGFALPSSANVGDTINITGAGAGGWAAYAPWIAQGSSLGFRCVASSSTGAVLVACVQGGQLYTSTNYGVTWSAPSTPNGPNWQSVACSSSGAMMVAVAYTGQIYTSTNSGQSWSQAYSGSQNWTSVASSANGNVLIATAYNGDVWISTDAGLLWGATNSGIQNWNCVACASDASLIVAGAGNGQLYTSTNGGSSWTARASSATWLSVAASSNGVNLVAAASGGYLYTSSNSGVTWTAQTSASTGVWNSVACSADGTKLVAAEDQGGGHIYVSANSGVTWTQVAPSQAWESVASSADGTKLVAAAAGGQIYTSDGNLFGVQGATASFVYLGNGQWSTIAQTQIAAGAVTSTQLAANAVQSSNIANGAIGTAQLAPGSVQTADIANGAITAAQLSTSVTLWSSNNGSINYNSGYVGIGTSTPAYQFQTTGSALFGSGNNAALGVDQWTGTYGADARLGFLKAGSQPPVIATAAFNDIIFSETNQIGIFSNIATASLTELMRITSKGNVGINTPTPQSMLDISYSGQTPLSASQHATSSYPLFVHGSSQGITIDVVGGDSQAIPNHTNDYLRFTAFAGDVELGSVQGQDASDLVNSFSYIWFNTMSTLQVAFQAAALAADGADVAPAMVAVDGAQMLATVAQWAVQIQQLDSSVGIIFQSGTADYAEWLEKRNPGDELNAAEIVGVSGGKISKDTAGAEKCMVVSTAPIVAGNAPQKKDEKNFRKVAFVGQVPVKVRGAVHVGDYIVPSDLNDGYGLGLAPDRMTLADYKRITGVAWSASKSSGEGLVKVAVGINTNDLTDKLIQQQAQIDSIVSYLKAKDPDFPMPKGLVAKLRPSPPSTAQAVLAKNAPNRQPDWDKLRQLIKDHPKVLTQLLDTTKAQLISQGIDVNKNPQISSVFNTSFYTDWANSSEPVLNEPRPPAPVPAATAAPSGKPGQNNP